METVTYTPADVERANRLAKTLRDRAKSERREAVDVDLILREVGAIAIGARERSYAPGAKMPHPTPEGIKHVALVTDAVRAREHALTRMASALECAAAWIEEMAKFNAPVTATATEPATEPLMAEATLDTVASEG